MIIKGERSFQSIEINWNTSEETEETPKYETRNTLIERKKDSSLWR